MEGSASAVANRTTAGPQSVGGAVSHQTTKGFDTALWALVDQAAVSGARFAATILVGRFAGKEGLGTYYMAFAFVMAALSIHEALVALPYSVFAQRRRGTQREESYTRSTLFLALIVGSTLGCLLAVAAAIIRAVGYPPGLSGAIAAAALGMPAIFVVEFARRRALACFMPLAAVRIDYTSASLQTGGLALLAYWGWLTPTNAYLMISACFVLVAGLWLVTEWRFWRGAASPSRTALMHWRLGRWVFGTQLLQTLRGASIPWLAALLLGRAEAGQLAASLTIVLLANPFLLSMNNILSPTLARSLRIGGPRAMQSAWLKATVQLTAAMTVLAGVLVAAHRPMMSMFFGNEYLEHSWLVPLLASAMVIEAAGLPAMGGLWAMRRGSENLWANAWSAAMTVALCGLGTVQFGLEGAAAAVVLGRCVSTALQIDAFCRAVGQAQKVCTTVPEALGSPEL